jgi:hypothetical protein
MGLEIAAIAMAGIAIGAEVGKSDAEIKSAHAQEQALDLQAKQTALQTQQKTLSNYDVLQKVLDAQIAHQTVTGTAFSSPSFNAIQRNAVNIGSKKQRNTDIEGDLEQANIEIEKKNVRSKLYAELFGNVADTANTAFSVASKMPTSGGA